MGGVRGKGVLVTGGGSGIGAATCTALAAEGCHVAGMDRQADALAVIRQQLRDAGQVAVSATADVRARAEVEPAVAAAARRVVGSPPHCNLVGVRTVTRCHDPSS